MAKTATGAHVAMWFSIEFGNAFKLRAAELGLTPAQLVQADDAIARRPGLESHLRREAARIVAAASQAQSAGGRKGGLKCKEPTSVLGQTAEVKQANPAKRRAKRISSK